MYRLYWKRENLTLNQCNVRELLIRSFQDNDFARPYWHQTFNGKVFFRFITWNPAEGNDMLIIPHALALVIVIAWIIAIKAIYTLH